jgi:hypothetical protein
VKFNYESLNLLVRYIYSAQALVEFNCFCPPHLASDLEGAR